MTFPFATQFLLHPRSATEELRNWICGDPCSSSFQIQTCLESQLESQVRCLSINQCSRTCRRVLMETWRLSTLWFCDSLISASSPLTRRIEIECVKVCCHAETKRRRAKFFPNVKRAISKDQTEGNSRRKWAPFRSLAWPVPSSFQRICVLECGGVDWIASRMPASSVVLSAAKKRTTFNSKSFKTMTKSIRAASSLPTKETAIF